MYFQKLITSIKENPLEIFLGLFVVALMMFGASVKDVASTTLAIFTLFGLSKVHRYKISWGLLSTIEKVMFIAFVVYVLSGFLSYINVEDSREYVKQMDRYIRFFFIGPIVLAAIYSKLDFKRFFYIGVVLSGPAYFYFAIESSLENPSWPAGRDYHHITFGDAATLNALLMMLMLVLEPWKKYWKILIMMSISFSLYASVLSQARGAWIAIPVGVLVACIALIRQSRLKVSYALLAFMVLVFGVFITPAGDMIGNRYSEATKEVELFVESRNAATSIGGRLALWDISMQVWKSSPLLGTGPGDFDDEVRSYQSKSGYQELIVHSSTHNIYLQALVNTGLVGFIVLVFALIVFPFLYFYSYVKKGDKFGYYGLIVITAYAVFGLTESWVLRAPVVSIYIIYFIVILLACRHEEKKHRVEVST